MNNEICDQCPLEEKCFEGCEAMNQLSRVIKIDDAQWKRQELHELGEELGLFECEPDKEIEAIAQEIIDSSDRLGIIPAFDIQIGYVRSIKAQKSNGDKVLGKCTKTPEVYKAWLPFDFVIVIYTPNCIMLDDDQMRVLIYHELRHIGVGPQGLKVKNHDIEEFRDIIDTYGLDWQTSIKKREGEEE